MISISKLLFDDEYFGDSLRYHHASRGVAMVPPVVQGRWWFGIPPDLQSKLYSLLYGFRGQKYSGELTTEEAKQMIDDLADFKVPVLLFSGGEPLIRPDILELAEYAGSKGIRPTLSTNGTLISREVAQRIKDIGVGYVGISLDGLREVNDKFRGKPGAFQSAMEGIQNCVAVGQRVGLRFTINRHNLAELDNIFDFIEEEKSIGFVLSPGIFGPWKSNDTR